MSVLAPAWLALAGLAVMGLVALHAVSLRRPPRVLLPTARFVPAHASAHQSRVARPSDLLLLVLRAACVLLFGLAWAGPVWRGSARIRARVVLVDQSRSARADTKDSAVALWRPGDVLVLFDSTARASATAPADSLHRLALHEAPGALSPALVQARRAIRALAPRGDSADLIIVSPLTLDEVDNATRALLSRWPGAVRVVRGRSAPARGATIELTGDDATGALGATDATGSLGATDATGALRPLVTAAAATASRQQVVLLRTLPARRDSARAAAGAAVVSWPAVSRAVPTAEGVWVRGATVVAPLVRLSAEHPGGVVVARWADGTPAAVEEALGSGCLRWVSIGVPLDGDVPLQPAMLAVTRQLLGPCGGAVVGRALNEAEVASLRDTLAAGAVPLESAPAPSALAPWLAGAAALLLLAELFVRRAHPAAS